jgi:uncharacterized protein
MKRGFYCSVHPMSKIAMTAFVSLVCLIILMIITALLAIPIFGIDAFTGILSSSLTVDENNVDLLKFFQLGQSIGLFIIPAIILAFLFDCKPGHYLAINRYPKAKSALLATLIVLSASPLINVLGVWNAAMKFPSFLAGIEEWMKQSEETAAQLTDLFVNVQTTKGLLYNIFLIAVIPAIGEELLFRGVIQRVFTDWTRNKHMGIWISAILFSALHMQFYGFIPRAVLGGMFGYLLVFSGNLWLPVIAHFVNNAAAVIAYYLYGKGKLGIDPDQLGVESAYGIAAIFSAMVVIVLFLLYQRNEKHRVLKE